MDFYEWPYTSSVFRQHVMYGMQTSAIDDPVAWASVSLSVTQATVLAHFLDDATSMQPSLHYCMPVVLLY